MSTRVLLSAVVVGLVLAGYGQESSSQPCNAQVCFITITVDADCSTADKIHLNKDPLEIDKNNHGNDPTKGPEIHWDINTANYTFASLATAIVFTPPPPPPAPSPASEFTNPHLASGNTKYMVNDKNSSTTNYKYTINLVKDGITPCAPKDPIIANGK